MRRTRPIMALLTVLFLLLALAPAAVAAPDEWNLMPDGLEAANITIDGIPASFTGYIVNSRTVVPMRALFEALGAKIEWNPDTFTVTATKGSKVIVLSVGKVQGKIDGKDYTLAVPPVLINSRTYVPVRFVIDALGLDIKWDQATFTVMINTGTGCTKAGPTVHEGTISPGGETWGKCGAPHIIARSFMVEGKDSPILTIEEGTMIRFEADASLQIGRNAPGGLVVNGKASNPVYFTADTSGPQPGFWEGIRFFNQTLINDSRINGAVIEYAGTPDYGALLIEGYNKMVEVQLNDVEFKNNLHAGLHMTWQGRLRSGSGNLKVNGTTVGNEGGGFPIVTAAFGSHNLPRGEYKNNAVNAVNINEMGSGSATISSNTTWRNVSIPYAMSQNVYVEGTSAPTLTIEPGVITLWKSETGLTIGQNAAGHLVADALARPEGGGEWFTRPEGGGEWRVEKAELDLGVQLADAISIEPGCALCGKNRAIVFGAWNAAPDRGAWEGVRLLSNAGDKSRLNGVVIAWGGRDTDWSAGLYAETNGDKTIKFMLAKSMIYGASRSGLEFYGNAQLRAESTGNFFVNNGWPVRMPPSLIGYLPVGQTFAENTKQTISIYTSGTSDEITRSATWRNHGIPYQFELTVYIGGTASPVITIEPGTTLLFGRDHHITIGTQNGAGSLVAVGAAGKPITFSTELKRAGAWAGVQFTENAGAGNRLENVVIEYATVGVSVNDDLGGFIKNATIRNSSEMGIYRGYDVSGTSFTLGLGNQFEGNAVDQNQE
ncbi:MAG TPA: copper amine oxidase N-terminal domain-containing protein [Symbiobacteriaceae bacterium]|nr:copper amine oxidase N-terminal domain-containing protein [Symbiobacteriaceae bacterium]